jgi:PAS domain S-box-containing protein
MRLSRGLGDAEIWLSTASERQISEVEALQRRVAELEAENARLAATSRDSPLRAVLTGSPVFVYEMDTDLRYRWVCNPPGPFNPDQWVGRRDDETTPFEHARRRMDLKRRVLATGIALRTEVTHHDGTEVRYFDLTLEPIRDANRRITGLAGAALDITERRRTEQRVRESEARFRAIVDDQTEFISRFTPTFTITFVNRAYAAQLGRSREALIGTSVLELMTPEQQSRFRAQLTALTPDRPTVTYEMEAPLPDGSSGWELWTDRALFDERGAVREYQSVGRDISEQRRAELALRKSEERLRLAVEATRIGIFDVDAVTGQRRWSDEYKAIIGLPREANPDPELYSSLIHPEDRAWVNERYWGAYRSSSGGRYRAEYRILRASDGALRWVRNDGRVFFDDAGQPQRAIGTLVDVTERRLTEEALRASEEQLRLALESSALGMWDVDILADTVRTDERFHEIFGLGLEEAAVPANIWQHIHPEDVPALQAALAQAKEPRSGGAYEVEYRYLRPGGGVRWHAARARVHFTQVGEERRASRMVGVVMDITERKRALESLVESEARLRLALDAGRMGIWSWDIATGEQSWDATQYQLFGVEPGTVITRDLFLQRVHPDDRKQIELEVARPPSTDQVLEAEFRIRLPDGRERWLASRAALLRDGDGKPRCMTGVNFDVTEARLTAQALIDAQRFLEQVADISPAVIFVGDLTEARIVYVNDGISAVLGWQPDRLKMLSRAGLQELVHPEDLPRLLQGLASVSDLKEGGGLEVEGRFRHADQGWRWLVLRVAAFARGPAHEVQQVIAAAIDIGERKAAEAHQQLLLHELSHRVKNTLATLQSIVTITARTAASVEQFRDTLNGRILALSDAHSLLTQHRWGGVALRTVAERALAPFGGQPGRIVLGGEPVVLGARAALAVAMALHELGTNAVKYGALSTLAGSVRLDWRTEPDGDRGPMLLLSWNERDGPRVEPSPRVGFGSRLLRQGLAHELGASVQLEFEPAGVSCRIRFSLRPAAEAPEAG